ncbi:CFI-box-CTERM domain-containing protein [Haloplanus natans]|uniref:CFI-box-CTERM domain-containing protein n=1 Tax=Haloplanus natans TaxID=376171 RepID=UPI00067797CD|nr:CFI-box-CTERM domain-containing protein [Haloplanus natans]
MSTEDGSDAETDTEAADTDDERPLSEVGVGDGREKHLHVVTESGKEIDHEEVYLRHTETEYLVSPDVDFPPAETTRYRKENIDRVKVTQHHSNCFITTATAGEGPTLDSLRGFRADVMAPSRTGRALLRIYEATSPPIAATLARHPESTATRLVRGLVDRCGGLADRRRAASGDGERAALSLALITLYVVGVCLGVLAHGWLRTRERWLS